ncbi:MAG: acetyl-CoA carboxylase, carboxyltransferase subunit beta [Pseudomonadota bacterium]
MNWLSDITPPGIKNMFRNREGDTDTLWVKCPSCADMIFHRDMEAAHNVCPSCGHHLPVGAKERLAFIFDEGAYERIATPDVPLDPLKFRDEKKYVDRLRDARKKTGEDDAMILAVGKIDGVETVVALQNFAFMGGSMGAALGEAFIRAAEEAVARKCALVCFTASGGARMQEGILSLMQMPRTTIGVQMVKEAGLPYIVVLTHPTTGGVTASYAMLGDVHLAEPGALIGFAGPRVIEQTIREKLPEGFQRSEYLFEKGMVDAVVSRAEMKSTLGRLMRVFLNIAADAPAAPVAEPQVVANTDEPAAPASAPEPKTPAAKDPAPANDAEPLDKAAE